MYKKKESGAVLVISLVFLLLTSIIASTTMRTSIFEIRMAGNEQLKEEAFQKVQGILNAISTNTNNFVVAGDVGYKICKTGISGCDTAVINIDSSVESVPTNVTLDYHIERLGPLNASMAFRVSEDSTSSASAYTAALFEVNVSYDGSGAALAKSEVAQGIAYRIASGSQ